MKYLLLMALILLPLSGYIGYQRGLKPWKAYSKCLEQRKHIGVDIDDFVKCNNLGVDNE